MDKTTAQMYVDTLDSMNAKLKLANPTAGPGTPGWYADDFLVFQSDDRRVTLGDCRDIIK